MLILGDTVNSILRIEDFADDFDPFTAFMTTGGEGDITDPHPVLAKLRKAATVQEADLNDPFDVPRHATYAGYRSFLVLGFEECATALFESESFSNKAYEATVLPTFGKSMTIMDAPEHAKYRRLFQAGFTPKMLNGLKPRFEAVVDRLIDRLAGGQRANLVQDFVVHFPFQFICDLMDLPIEDRPIFHKIAHAQTCITFDHFHGTEASRILGTYLSALIAARRALKSDTDFVSVIANARTEDGAVLPDDVILGFFRQLMNAGGDTSYHGFSNILTALFSHPEQLEAVRQDRALIPATIEEGLRWYGPFTALDRLATRDVALGGTTIPAGALVRVCVAAANRDDTRWADPDKFDIYRPLQRNLAFGSGPHICVGQHLARMELQIALNRLLDRLPNLRLDEEIPPPLIRGLTFRGASAVHVRWD